MRSNQSIPNPNEVPRPVQRATLDPDSRFPYPKPAVARDFGQIAPTYLLRASSSSHPAQIQNHLPVRQIQSHPSTERGNGYRQVTQTAVRRSPQQ